MRTLFDAMMDRMVVARWLVSYTFTDGKGYWLNWSEAGTERAICLRKIALTFELANGDTRPMTFDKVAHGERPTDGTRIIGKLDETIAGYWRDSIAQLGSPRTEDELIVLVQIVTGWAPDATTNVKFF